MLVSDLNEVKTFADRAIGDGYYSTEEIKDIFSRGEHFSLVLSNEKNQIFGIRITYPPGKWNSGKGQGLCSDQWKVDLKDTAYFQSLFIDPNLVSQGWGKKMSLRSIEMLQNSGAKAIVTHSWKESPNDSSGIYLRSLGFTSVKLHPLYWNKVNYTCTRCGFPCLCTAEEMILYI